MMTDFSVFYGVIQASQYEFIALWTVHWMKCGGQSHHMMTLPWCTVVSQCLACPPLSAAGPPWAGCSPALPYPLTDTVILAHGCKCRLGCLTIEQMSHLRDEIKPHFKTKLRHGQLIDHS
jgi:hypothetical protein